MSSSTAATPYLRSIILLIGVPSIHDSFKNRSLKMTIPRTPAADPSTKVRSLPPIPKAAQEYARDAAIASDAHQQPAAGGGDTSTAVLVDIGDHSKKVSPASYAAVFLSDPTDGPCWHCRREVGDKRMGIPLRIRDDRFHHNLIVDCEGRACNASCALAFVQDHAAEHTCYEGRVMALKQINELCNPGTKLVAAPSWRLLNLYGGPFTSEQFDACAQTFAPMPYLQYRQASVSYAPS